MSGAERRALRPHPGMLKRNMPNQQSSDLRSLALNAHTAAHDPWGKKKTTAGANNSLECLEPSEVEAYALDIALRRVWELQREGSDDTEELTQCAVPSEWLARLRQVVMNILEEHVEQLTTEHTFVIDDPAVVEERERIKREQAIAEMKEREARQAAIEEEKRVREAKLQEEMARAKELEDAQPYPEDTDAEGADPDEKKKKSRKRRLEGTLKRRKKTKDKDKELEPDADGDAKKKKKKRSKSSKKTDAEPAPAPCEAESTERGRKRKKSRKDKAESDDTKNEAEEDATPSQPLNNGESAQEQEARTPASAAPTVGRARGRTRQLTVPKITRPQIQRGGQVVEEEEPIPTITIVRQLVDLTRLNPLLEEGVTAAFHAEIKDMDHAPHKLDCYHLSVRGPRPSNEDEYVLIEDVNQLLGVDEKDMADRYSYFAVYDGHSGKYTSMYTRSQLHKNLFAHPQFPADEAIHEAFIKTDRCVNEIQSRNKFNCGTTALGVALRNERELIVGNVGDCRGFLCRGGQPFEIATPHNPDGEAEKERIKELGGSVVWFGTWRVNGILAVSRSIGDYNLRHLVIPDPDVTRFDLQENDEFLLIASDGLWNGVQPEEAIDLAKRTIQELGRKYVCKALCEMGVERDTRDNVTVLVVFFDHLRQS